MKTSTSDARGLRRALAAVAISAGSILLLAPVAGAAAEPPAAAGHGQERASGNAAGQPASGPASDAGPDAGGDQTPPAHSNAGGSQNPNPSNGSEDPESPGASGEHKQTICHRTRSAANPYVMITVDFHAVDGELVEATSDHAERHEGPVFDPDTMTSGDAWGDIIPPFTFEGTSFDGQNWEATGQEIFENGCELPTTETETGGEGIENEGDDDEDVTPVVGGGEVTDPQPGVEEQPEPDVEGDVMTKDQTPTNGTGVLGTAAAPASDAQVLGAVVTRTPTGVAGAQVSSLPRTGNATGLLGAAGVALVGLGLALVRGSRRIAPTA